MLTIIKKNEFRNNALKVREKLALSGQNAIKSHNIISKILNSCEFINAKNVALYYPIKNEIDLTGLLKIKTKNFYLPICENNELFFVKYIDENNLVNGAFNIKVPLGEKIDPNILDVIYIPALMANNKNYRLGYGKGFYDRFFEKNNIIAKKIIVLADELICDDFIEEEFDFQCDKIISS